MSKFGIKISQTGVDVKTGADDEMVLHSDYSIFKGSIQGSGSTTVSRDGTPTTITVAHGLSYAPMVQAFFSDTNGSLFASGVYIAVPIVFFDGATQCNVVASSDSTNIYITFTVLDLL